MIGWTGSYGPNSDSLSVNMVLINSNSFIVPILLLLNTFLFFYSLFTSATLQPSIRVI